MQGSHMPPSILHVCEGISTFNTSYPRIHNFKKAFDIAWNENFVSQCNESLCPVKPYADFFAYCP